ncbi:hypothetical protein SO802_009641 [Lithocarpus litseifolius]|uniref:Uncharacterized protein n=1 Tax=Lithocarpus litseifolius TaxID=425828 RepID=A0AAW2DEX1_9ROSI
MVSGEALKDAWRSANDGFEQFLYEAKKAAERVDHRFSVSRCLSSVAHSAANRARKIDKEFEIGVRWRTFSLDFTRNLPRLGHRPAKPDVNILGFLLVMSNIVSIPFGMVETKMAKALQS